MSEYLPTDLILQIISRLPFKSIARCRCLSKLWASLLTLDSPYFTELFSTQSTIKPCLLFVVRQNDDEDWCLYSSPQPQISYKNLKPSLSVTAEFQMSLQSQAWSSQIFTPLSGLIYCSCMPDYDTPLLCNPTTRQRFWLPQITEAERSFFGYDPINKRFSVLAFSFPLHSYPFLPYNRFLPSSYQILNLEYGKLSWRSLDCPLQHFPLQNNICINGILYYLASFVGPTWGAKTIACFDLNGEEFKFIHNPWTSYYQPPDLVNFKGKLCGIHKKWVKCGKKISKLELSLWVLEDVEKQKWSKYVYLLPKLWDRKRLNISIVGVTVTGEAVLSLSYMFHPFYLYFCNLEKNIFQKVEIKGFKAFKNNSFRGWVDYVEGLKDINWS